jgi:hypothetical protein
MVKKQEKMPHTVVTREAGGPRTKHLVWRQGMPATLIMAGRDGKQHGC